MSSPTLLFCVGAQKAGTTWFGDYLLRHPQCYIRGVKELHYFDALDLGSQEGQARRLAQKRLSIEERADGMRGPKRDKLRARLGDFSALISLHQKPEDPAAYVAYLTQGVGDRRLVADITPAYALLSASRLEMMAGLMPDTRFLFLMRDPVSRVWSNVRMAARRGGDLGALEAAKILTATLAGDEPAIANRSDYRGAIERLTSAVAPEKLLIMFFEEMMTPAGIERICAFLGIDAAPPNFARVVHAGQPLPMEPEQDRAAREWLAPQYRYVAEFMGRLPPAWEPKDRRIIAAPSAPLAATGGLLPLAEVGAAVTAAPEVAAEVVAEAAALGEGGIPIVAAGAGTAEVER